MRKLFFEKTLLFIGSLVVVALCFIIGSYYFFMDTYNRLENTQNTKYVHALVKGIEHELLSLNRLTMDYSMAEESHAIADNKTKTNSLKLRKIFDIPSLDVIAISNTKDVLLFEDYAASLEIKNKTTFMEKVFQQSQDKAHFNGTFIFENKIFYLSKEPITKTHKKKPSGYLYFIKSMDNQQINAQVKVFSQIQLSKRAFPSNKDTQILTSKFFSAIYANTYYFDKYSTNIIQFYDKTERFSFSIKTTKKTDIINAGKSTLLHFIYVAIVFLAIISFITHKYMKAIKINNEVLEEEVEKRTEQIKSALEELEKVNLKLYDIAHTDFLTKVRNRRNFFIYAENLYSKSVSQSRPLSVIMIDIDNFKSFNDSYGHDVGDKVLIMFANCVKDCLENGEIFGRLGGEEFAVALFDTDLNDSMQKAEFIRSSVEKLELHTASTTLKITASFGISDKSGCETLDQMLQKSDKMLYSAKRSGKNRVRSRLNHP